MTSQAVGDIVFPGLPRAWLPLFHTLCVIHWGSVDAGPAMGRLASDWETTGNTMALRWGVPTSDWGTADSS